ncbi:hypothetical protein DFH28DRAFT_261331 [Melampsora americana]|nr:hypothetical protein DFH28DRAFT_261331 [Melampsora americana]
MDRSSTFTLYYDPEISAPQSALALTASPTSKSSSLYSPTPTGTKSSPQLLSPSRRSLRPSVSTGRLVLGELPLRTRVNPFHRSQRNKLVSCARRQSATCDSRLKHEIYLFPEVSAPSNYLNASGGDKVEVDDNLSNDLPSFTSSSNLRRSTICGPQTRPAEAQTADDIALPSDHPTSFASGSSSPATAPFTSGVHGNLSSLPPLTSTSCSVSSTDSHGPRPIDLPNIVEETKENVPLARKQASPPSYRVNQSPAKTVQAAHPDHLSIMTPSDLERSPPEGSSVSVPSSPQYRLNAAKSRLLYVPPNRRPSRSFPLVNFDEVPGALSVPPRKSSLTLNDYNPAQRRHWSLPNTPMRI